MYIDSFVYLLIQNIVFKRAADSAARESNFAHHNISLFLAKKTTL